MRERGRRDKRGLADATLIGGEVKLAVTHRSRLVGLLKNPDELSPLLIAPCRDVHTFGMRVSLDIAFLDANGVVMRVSRDVGRWRRIRCPVRQWSLNAWLAKARGFRRGIKSA